jgi:hypothetical protein
MSCSKAGKTARTLSESAGCGVVLRTFLISANPKEKQAPEDRRCSKRDIKPRLAHRREKAPNQQETGWESDSYGTGTP